MNTNKALRAALAELEDAITCEGFGCACTPQRKCATCAARDTMEKNVRKPFEKLRAALSQPQEQAAVAVVDSHAEHWSAVALAAEAIAKSENCSAQEAQDFCAAIDRLSAAMLSDEPQERTAKAVAEVTFSDPLALHGRVKWLGMPPAMGEKLFAAHPPQAPAEAGAINQMIAEGHLHPVVAPGEPDEATLVEFGKILDNPSERSRLESLRAAWRFVALQSKSL